MRKLNTSKWTDSAASGSSSPPHFGGVPEKHEQPNKSTKIDYKVQGKQKKKGKHV